jgi:urease accessory protein
MPSSPLMITARLTVPGQPEGALELPYELRCRSRIRARLTDGTEVGVVLERGQLLRNGDLLRAMNGRVIVVLAAREHVTTARSEDPGELARAAYHLGNRHVALQVGPRWLRYRHDHVLDEMVRGLGLRVMVEEQPFEPEAGAYSTHGGAASHAHEHEHAHRHDTP